MKTSDDISALIPALCKAQCTVKSAKKDAENPFHKSKYADLSSIQEACKIPLIEQGLIILQDVSTTENSVLISTRIIHSSGQWMEVGPLSIPVTKKDAQGIGSAITYGRRYSLATMLCIVTEEDDDGNGAIGLTETKKPIQQEAKKEVEKIPEKRVDPAVYLTETKKPIQQQAKKEVEKIPEKRVDPAVYLTEEQHGQLIERLKSTTQTYKDNFPINVKRFYNVDDYRLIPSSSFSGLMTSMQTNIDSQPKESNDI